MNALKNNPSVLNLLRQYEALPPRDRSALKLLFATALVLLLYFAAWAPAQAYMDQAKSDLEYNQGIVELISTNRSVLASSSRSGGSGTNKAPLDSQQLVSKVTNMAKRGGVTLKRFEPSGDNKLKVWVDDAAFDKFVKWLVTLDKTLGVKVEQITIEKDDAQGHVSARMTLSS